MVSAVPMALFVNQFIPPQLPLEFQYSKGKEMLFKGGRGDLTRNSVTMAYARLAVVCACLAVRRVLTDHSEMKFVRNNDRLRASASIANYSRYPCAEVETSDPFLPGVKIEHDLPYDIHALISSMRDSM